MDDEVSHREGANGLWGILTIERVWMAIPFFIAILKGFRFPLPSLDFWWHLKMGEVIVNTHSIPRTDIFSFTAAGETFITQNWLAEVIYYSVFRLGGLPALVCLNAALHLFALIPVVSLCRNATGRSRVASIAALLSCLAFFPNARPQVFSVFLFSVFYWILDEYRFRNRNVIWLLPILSLLWVNLHGAFVVGFGLIGLFLLCESIRRWTNLESDDVLSRKELKQLAIVLIACLISTFLNPENYRVYDYIRQVLSDRASQQYVMEWQPPRIDSIFLAKYFYMLFYLALIGLIRSKRKVNATDLILFLGFSLFGFTALRNTIWFAIVVAPLLARYWGDLEIPSVLRKRPTFFHSSVRSNLSPQPHHRFNLVLFSIAFLLVLSYSPWIGPALNKTSLIDPKLPVKAVDFVEQHGLYGRFFHPQVFGDYLIWRLYPRQRTFIDGRVHLFGESFVKDFLNIFYDSRWEDKLASLKIQYLLLSKDDMEDGCRSLIQRARASSNWKVLFEDGVAVLFARKFQEGYRETNSD